MPMRMRRLRRTDALRRMVRETRLDPAQFIWPLFVRSGKGLRAPIGSMPGGASFVSGVVLWGI
jgi:porphobilinogen synthase